MKGLTQLWAKTRTTRELRKRVPYNTGTASGFTSVPDGTEEIFFETSIDMGALCQLAQRAAGNKRQAAKAGPIFVTILQRRKL